jgi:hypothetical protein
MRRRGEGWWSRGRKDGWDEDDVDKKSQDETAVMGIN